MRLRTCTTRTIRLATATATIGAVLAVPLANAASAASPTIPVGSSPYAVAVNASTNTVYVANYDGNSVSVINGSTNTLNSRVTVGAEPAGVAVNPVTNTVYVANLGSNSVSVINGATLPQAPNIVSSSAGNGSVSLAWTAPSAGDG